MMVVAAALINCENAVLMQQRGFDRDNAGKWEFPGGKVEDGEDCRSALVRELAEELAISVDKGSLHEFTFVTGPGHGKAELILFLYVCRCWIGEPLALDAATFKWIEPAKLDLLPLVPLDRPLAARLMQYLDR